MQSTRQSALLLASIIKKNKKGSTSLKPVRKRGFKHDEKSSMCKENEIEATEPDLVDCRWIRADRIGSKD